MQDKVSTFTYDQSNILYDALTLYLQDTEDRIDYRARYGLQADILRYRRTVAATMRGKARSQTIKMRIAMQDKVSQDKGECSG